MNITATSQNSRWKAFIGQINGKFTLDDASTNTIYDWTSASVNGVVYATRNSTAITWGTARCANETEIVAEDTFLEHAGEDSINLTFTPLNNSEIFQIGGGITIFPNTCASINTYINDLPQSVDFEEVILYDTTSANIIFATILEQDVAGYDNLNYDFQMIVPENGSATWSGQTPYYLYLELVS
jgi:hypothetical protein